MKIEDPIQRVDCRCLVGENTLIFGKQKKRSEAVSLDERCNILFIMADQFRCDALRHVGGYGRTDALDALATDGMSFRDAVTTSPQCIPARFALATSLYPHQTGVWRNGAVTLSPFCWSWTRALADAGYRTSLFGKTHFHETAQATGDLRDGIELMQGYGLLDVDEIAGPRASVSVRSAMTEEWERHGLWDLYRADFAERFATRPWMTRPSPLGVHHYYDTYVGRRALEYLSCYDRREPWFCWVSFAGPHEPWDTPEPYNRLHSPAEMPPGIPRIRGWDTVGGLLRNLFRSPEYAPSLDESDIAAIRANYAGNVTLIDDQIQAILDFLKKAAVYDKTLILFTSDHGEMNGDHGLIHKSNFLASAVDIPFILKPPKRCELRPGGGAELLVELIDAGTTILDYAGLGWPKWANGRSLRPVLEGHMRSYRPYVVSEFRGHTMIATRSWKCEFDAHARPVLLFNRTIDRLEQHNVVADHELMETLDSLQRLLQKYRDSTSGNHEITL
jgi:arylsulfatase